MTLIPQQDGGGGLIDWATMNPVFLKFMEWLEQAVQLVFECIIMPALDVSTRVVEAVQNSSTTIFSFAFIAWYGPTTLVLIASQCLLSLVIALYYIVKMCKC
jgi:hypothetical protein